MTTEIAAGRVRVYASGTADYLPTHKEVAPMTPTDLLVSALRTVTAGTGWRLGPEPLVRVPVPVRTNVIQSPERRGRPGRYR